MHVTYNRVSFEDKDLAAAIKAKCIADTDLSQQKIIESEKVVAFIEQMSEKYKESFEFIKYLQAKANV